MTEAGFDTLSAARNLKASGLEGGQAEAIVTEISQSRDNLVTVERFEAGHTELRTHTDTAVTDLRAHIDTAVTDLRAHIDTGLADLRAHVDTGFANLRSEIAELKANTSRMLLAFATFVVAAFALIATIASILVSVFVR